MIQTPTHRIKTTQEQTPQIDDLIDASTEAADAVKEALEAQEAEEDSQNEAEQEPEEQQGDFQANYSTEVAADDELREEKDPLENLSVNIPVRVDNVPITDMDKRVYLKAMLNEAPVELEIKMQNGFIFTVRSLSKYEETVVTAAGIWNYKDQAEMSLAEGMGIGAVQQYRVSMQITSVNGNPIHHAAFAYKHGESDLQKDAEYLRTFSNDKLMNAPGPLYGLYLRAIEVFLRKMNVLQDAAYSLNFWPPESGA